MVSASLSETGFKRISGLGHMGQNDWGVASSKRALATLHKDLPI